MSIRLGLYDFFAYTIPGGLYLLALVQLGNILGWVSIDFQTINSLSVLSIVLAVVLFAIAYITGHIFEPFAKRWRRLFFKSGGLQKRVFDGVKAKYPDTEIKFRLGDWTLLLAYLRLENAEVAAEIARPNVTSIMLRNVSLGLILLAVLQIVEFIHTGFLVWHLVLSVALVIASIVAGRESVKFQRWFYSGIYEAIIARTRNLSDWAEPRITAKGRVSQS